MMTILTIYILGLIVFGSYMIFYYYCNYCKYDRPDLQDFIILFFPFVNLILGIYAWLSIFPSMNKSATYLLDLILNFVNKIRDLLKTLFDMINRNINIYKEKNNDKDKNNNTDNNATT